MGKLKCDFHIHTGLSPCASNDMTPGNIVGMSKLKGLDAIAITDHNTCKNIESAIYQAKKYDITVIPGMELETSEQIHCVCLFRDVASAFKFESIVNERLPDIKNNEKIFGEQLIYDKEDNVKSKESSLLISSVNMSFIEALNFIKELDGIIYPAHIDRDSYSILTALGAIPIEYKGKILEISTKCNVNDLIRIYPDLNKYKFLIASDAHYLWEILEGETLSEYAQLINVNNNISSIFEALND